jgi:hypothetical protein
MYKRKPHFKLTHILFISLAVFFAGCIKVKTKQKTPTLLSVSNANQTTLFKKVNYMASVNSINAKMYLKFEDNSYAESGIAEKYKTADSTVVVQRPASILLKVEVPIIGTDVAQMTSDGEKFRVAILEDGAGGKYKRFVVGTNSTDYSRLKNRVTEIGNGDAKELKKNVNAFSNLRPQHFTDAMLMRPIDNSKYVYTMSTILREEFDISTKKESPVRWVLRGYYLLDEYHKTGDGKMSISRRFWFDRVGGINLARQQIFDGGGEIESDIVYGKSGSVTKTGEYILPLQVEVTRPKEKYKIKLIYKAPRAVKIGKSYPIKAFVLKNTRKLKEVDLDKQLLEVNSGTSPQTSVQNNKN